MSYIILLFIISLSINDFIPLFPPCTLYVFISEYVNSIPSSFSSSYSSFFSSSSSSSYFGLIPIYSFSPPPTPPHYLFLPSSFLDVSKSFVLSSFPSGFRIFFCLFFKPVLFLVSSSCVFLFYFTSTLSFLLCFILLPYSLFLSVSIPSTYILYLQPPPHTYIHLQFSSWFRLILPFLFLSSSFFYSVCKFGLSVCLFVCLFVCNKRQNGWTDRAQICCGTSRDPREGLWMIKILNICLHQNSIFIKFLKILKIHEIFLWKSANYFCFVLRCTQREHVHN